MTIDQLTARGIMEASALYEAPFNSLHAGGPDELFATQPDIINAIFKKLKTINTNLQAVAG